MSSNFFADALRQAMATRHFNQAQLAEYLNVDPAYVSRWLKGSSPRIDQMRAVLIALGWKLERARPDYDPFEDAIQQVRDEPGDAGKVVAEKGGDYENLDDIRDLLEGVAESHKRIAHPALPVIGTIDGTSGEASFYKQTKEKIDSFSDLVPTLDFADNAIQVMTIKGSGLEPVYPEGTKLMVRAVSRLSSVPDGAEVIIEPVKAGGKLHLRRLYRISEGRAGRVDRVIGAPIVPTQEFLFFKPREVKVHAAVAGAFTGKR